MFSLTAAASAEIYTLSLHDALPILASAGEPHLANRELAPVLESFRPHGAFECALLLRLKRQIGLDPSAAIATLLSLQRSEEHTSELQSQSNLVCRLLLEKKNEPIPS